MNWRNAVVGLLALTALLLVGASSAAAAPQAQESGKRTPVFGDVVSNDGGILTVRTKDGEVTVTLTDETKVRARGGDEEDSSAIATGDRVAVLVVDGTAQSILVRSDERKQRKRVVHATGVVSEITEDGAVFVTADGTKRMVAFGLNAAPPELGTVVTLTGRVDAETGTLQVRSVHPLARTLERLNKHVDELDQATTDRTTRAKKLNTVRKLLEENSARQVQLLNRVADSLPQQAQRGPARVGHKDVGFGSGGQRRGAPFGCGDVAYHGRDLGAGLGPDVLRRGLQRPGATRGDRDPHPFACQGQRAGPAEALARATDQGAAPGNTQVH